MDGRVIVLRPPDEVSARQVNDWRRRYRPSLRTAAMKTEGQQYEWQENIPHKHRYWSLFLSPGTVPKDDLVGIGGLTDISWENGHAEISLIINPDHQGNGLGAQSVDSILDEAFQVMRLHMVYGECFECGPVGFWKKVVDRLSGRDFGTLTTTLPDRKFSGGTYWDSYYFSIFPPS
jgi:RimJ/RimL family protein N-acetyltransferase